jgi:hypothetical protein
MSDYALPEVIARGGGRSISFLCLALKFAIAVLGIRREE